ncbi:MAG: hypothetical protein PHC68_11470 [Syntrophorhabdaceae bacterium]|nr:hypothetical protein [Syntrophorhabdaceae bacterium]
MKYLVLIVALVLVLSGFSGKPDISDPSWTFVITYYNNHKITTWINDEPVLVADMVWNGYNAVFWPFLKKGENTIYLTAEKLPPEKTKEATEFYSSVQYPVDENGKEIEFEHPYGYDERKFKDGTTTVKLIEGNFFIPKETKEIKVWKVTQDKQESPRWVVLSKIEHRPSLDTYEDIKTIDPETKKQIEGYLKILQKALDSKDLKIAGMRESDIEEFLKKITGEKISVSKDIFSIKPYKAVVSPMSELEMIHGKKTIMVYRPDGEDLYSAGLAPGTPQEDGKKYYYLSGQALYFVKDKGILKPIWIK